MSVLKRFLKKFFPTLSVMIPAAAMLFGCGQRDQNDVFSDVDAAIERSGTFQAEKENEIERLRREFAAEGDDYRRLATGNKLIEQYEAYVSDSALHYVSRNLENPIVKADRNLTNRLLIKRADILSHAGLFSTAEQTLKAIPKAELDSTLLEQYYATLAGLYQYQIEYSDDTEFAIENDRRREAYIDSVIQYSNPSKLDYLINYASSRIRKGKYDEAIPPLEKALATYSAGQREYSILASLLAYAHQSQGDREKYKRYLALSAESDLQGAIKENMALRALATVCFEEGDLERANRYLKQSFSDANFYSARMRNAQSSRMLPVIDEAYQERQKILQTHQRIYLVTLSVLAVVLLVTIGFLAIQISRVHKANRQKQQTLEELRQLSDKLKELNAELNRSNSDLKNANTIKEEYAGLFMEYSSLALYHLQHYHQQLRTLAMKGNIDAIRKKLDSTEIESKTLKEFYAKFDEAIISIYPSFVEKFNALLLPGETVAIKPGEKLNTELRVFALMRIGINDPEKIARFLRCSLSTIYTYRSKMKKRATDPENFEKQVMNI